MTTSHDIDPEKTRVRMTFGQAVTLIAFIAAAVVGWLSLKADVSNVYTRLDGFNNAPGIAGRLQQLEADGVMMNRELQSCRQGIADVKGELQRQHEADEARRLEQNRTFGETLGRIETELKKGRR